MAKRTQAFSDRYLKSLKPTGKRYEITEPNSNGFGVRVSEAGTVTFYYFYKIGGSKKRVALGDYPGLTLADARTLASTVHGRRITGQWPLVPEPEPPAPPPKTFRTMWHHYIRSRARDCRLKLKKQKVPFKKNAYLLEQIRNIEKDVLHIYGELSPAEITRADINELIENIVTTRNAPSSAFNVFKVLREVFNFGIGTGQYGLDSSPCFMVKPPGRPAIAERNLGPAEIKLLWEILDTGRMFWSGQAGLKTLLLTGQRPSMVAEMPLAEIDDETWEVPGHRTKNGCIQRLFVLPTLKELLQLDEPRKWAFPLAKDTNRHIVRDDLRRVADRISKSKRWPYPSFCPNDLRRTVSTQMQALGIEQRVTDAIKHHVPVGARRHYDKYQFDKEKKQALLLWEARLKEILATGK